MDDDARYHKGFNAGYLLQKHEPEIANMLKAVKSEDSYLQALRAGREQYLCEMQERIKDYQKDMPAPSKGRDKGMEYDR